ncbi:S-layer homology domain-containing protein [Paenibacillus luteus]|uniref:S-layer homology domain-containing protein n=1 Tax=Paenibacillus luteus TaxID=2545753 RepID=UPI001144CA54|nr:S-layer homology domain-containing protein [Paenibacillus luteus]
MYKRLIAGAICGILTVILFGAGVYSAKAAAEIPELEVKSAQAGMGQIAVVELVMHRPAGLKAFEFQLTYDQTALEIVEPAVVGHDVADWLLEYRIDASRGTVKVAAVHGEGFRTDATAVLFRLAFKAIGSEGEKPLGISELKAFSGAGESMHLLKSKAGIFTIVDGSDPRPSPSPGPTENPVGPSQGDKSDWEVNVIIDDKLSKEVKVDSGKPDRITITVTAPSSVGFVQVGLSREVVKQLIDYGKLLEFRTPIGNLLIDSITMAAAGGAPLDIRLERKESSSAYKPSVAVSLKADGEVLAGWAGKVVVKVPYRKQPGESDEHLVVYRIEDGRRSVEPFAAMKDDEIVFVSRGSFTYEVGLNRKTFEDTTSHWSRSNIEFTTARGWFTGVDAVRFAPNETMTRGMLVTVLGRMLGMQRDADFDYKDVDADAYYAPYIAYATANGIVQGIGGSLFAPDRKVTREEMGHIIARFLEHARVSLSPAAAIKPFEDDSDIAAWAASSIRHLQGAGILNGREGHTYDPRGMVTRAEAAKVIRFIIDASLLNA